MPCPELLPDQAVRGCRPCPCEGQAGPEAQRPDSGLARAAHTARVPLAAHTRGPEKARSWARSGQPCPVGRARWTGTWGRDLALVRNPSCQAFQGFCAGGFSLLLD